MLLCACRNKHEGGLVELEIGVMGDRRKQKGSKTEVEKGRKNISVGKAKRGNSEERQRKIQ